MVFASAVASVTKFCPLLLLLLLLVLLLLLLLQFLTCVDVTKLCCWLFFVVAQAGMTKRLIS